MNRFFLYDFILYHSHRSIFPHLWGGSDCDILFWKITSCRLALASAHPRQPTENFSRGLLKNIALLVLCLCLHTKGTSLFDPYKRFGTLFFGDYKEMKNDTAYILNRQLTQKALYGPFAAHGCQTVLELGEHHFAKSFISFHFVGT